MPKSNLKSFMNDISFMVFLVLLHPLLNRNSRSSSSHGNSRSNSRSSSRGNVEFNVRRVLRAHM